MIDSDRGNGVTRRRLLQSGGAAAAIALIDLHPMTSALASSGADSSAPAYLRRSSYTPLADQDFTLSLADGTQQALKLFSISDLERAGLAGADDAFMLEFSGPTTQSAEQGIHTLMHPTLGSFELFSTPVDQPQSTQTYAVIVDRSIKIGSPQAPTSPSTTADSAASSQSSLSSGSAASAHKRAPIAHESIFHSVRVSRAAHGVVVEVSFAPGVHVTEIHAWLLRKHHPLGVASHHVKGDGARFQVPSTHRLSSGEYEIKLIATDRHGAKSGVSRDIKLA
jgi:hypothetical protein